MELELQEPIRAGETHSISLSSMHDVHPSTIDYIAGENTLLHISVRPADNLIAINDRIDGNWREEIRISLPRAYFALVLNVDISFDVGSASVTIAGTETVTFGRETDFAEVTMIRSNSYLELGRLKPKSATQGAALSTDPSSTSSAGATKIDVAQSSPLTSEPVVKQPAQDILPDRSGPVLRVVKKVSVGNAAAEHTPPESAPTGPLSIPHAEPVDFNLPPYMLPILAVTFRATGDAEAEGTIEIQYYEKDGSPIRHTPHGFTVSGPNVFVKRKSVPAKQAAFEELTLVPPYGAVSARIKLFGSGAVPAVVEGDSLLNFRESCYRNVDAEQLSANVAAVDESRTPIIYSSSAGPYRDDVLRLRPHYLAENYGRSGYNVVYFPLSDTLPTAHAAPGVIQKRRSDFFLYMQSILSSNSKPGIFVCSSLCDSQTILLLDRIKERGWKVLYEVRDDPEGMKSAGAGYGKWYNPHLERRLCRLADVVVTVSGPLRDRAIAFGALEEHVHVLPNGLEEEAFVHLNRNWSKDALAKRSAERTKVGYFGHLFSGRFDVETVAQAARACPDLQFELIGPGLHDPAPLMLPNVKLFGQKTIDEFYEISSSWDVGLLPFKTNRITFSLDPIKYYQYLAAGLKSVNSDVHNLRGAPFTFPYSADRSLASQIRKALATPVTEEDADVVRSYLSDATWELRSNETLKYLGYKSAE